MCKGQREFLRFVVYLHFKWKKRFRIIWKCWDRTIKNHKSFTLYSGLFHILIPVCFRPVLKSGFVNIEHKPFYLITRDLRGDKSRFVLLFFHCLSVSLRVFIRLPFFSLLCFVVAKATIFSRAWTRCLSYLIVLEFLLAI